MHDNTQSDSKLISSFIQVKEAVEIVTQRLALVDADLRSKKLLSLTIITGAGNHSENHRAKIKPEVEALLRKGGYPYIEEDGQLVVSFADASTIPQEPIRPERPVETTTPPAPHIISLLFSCLLSLCGLGNQSQQAGTNRSTSSQQPEQQDMDRGTATRTQKTKQGTSVQRS
mmetsp:Transcript_3107/g.3933  ORF Transcript_3107/g.3933 Transcript_3107/m.3933 type:complete len:172 (-) Transcript_3107:560-1075(-)